MLNIKVYHDSQDLFYRNPFGAVPYGTKVRLRVKIISEIPVNECLLRLWEKGSQEHLIKMSLVKERLKEKKIWQVFETLYTSPQEPGLVWYFFRITLDDQVYFYGNNKEGLGGVGKLRKEEPPSYQITVYKPNPVPRWFKEGVMYQIFVDRFFKGGEEGLSDEAGESIAKKKGLLHLNWYDTPLYIRDENSRVTRWVFFGGNLAGVKEKLDYLQELGITIIYFNPVFEAASSHKYDTADYMKIDGMFGNEEIFRNLVKEAKKRGISIILDGVFSHTGCDSIYFNRFGHFPEPGAYQSPDSPYAKWYTFTDECCQGYECWWGVDDLPNVDEMEPSYRDFIYKGKDSVVRHWMRTGIKGWRLDVADELPDEFIKELRQVLKSMDPEAVLIGEVWEDASNKISYGKLREYLWGDELDSIMNYPLRNIFLDFILGKREASSTHQRIMSLFENYPREYFYAAMNIIGSHDRERILTLLGEAPPGENLTEREKEVFRLDDLARDLAVKRLKLLSLLQMTFPGVPCVYYGDEAGMEGYADPYNRGTYPWGFEDQKLLEWYKRIIRLRREYGVFQDGEFSSFYRGQDVYGYSLKNSSEEVIILANRNTSCAREVRIDFPKKSVNEEKTLILDLLQGTIVKEKEIKNFKIPPLEARVFYIKGLKKNELIKIQLPKGCGVLLHLSSLPSKWGVGDMGEEAYRFIDFLSSAGQNIWQVLPLNPPGLGHSPYQSYSAFAGNTLFLDIEQLVAEGLLDEEEVNKELELVQKKIKVPDKAYFDLAEKSKTRLYRKAYQKFLILVKEQGTNEKKESLFLSIGNYIEFQKKNEFWLEDYCLYAALKEYFGGTTWYDWEQNIAERKEKTLNYYREKLSDEINFQCFLQYTFFTQWQSIKKYAHDKGIFIIGDLPIYVSPDSSDTWINRNLFSLDHKGRPSKVAGVPPDYFSKKGQLWGNPIYLWDEAAKDGYLWWVKRVKFSLEMYDYLRLDHFRGFEAFWVVSGGEKTAVNGVWLKGPGKRFFEMLYQELGDMPLIAEDLGDITPEVNNLKNIFGFPGMKVFQFAPEEMSEEGERNIVYYPGTHDNDTLVGWCRKQPGKYHYLEILEKIYRSHAAWVIVSMQDILGLDSEARMNTPGTVYGNWEWRLDKSLLTEEIASWLCQMAKSR
jgi:4-alpha-glucanotransferase